MGVRIIQNLGETPQIINTETGEHLETYASSVSISMQPGHSSAVVTLLFREPELDIDLEDVVWESSDPHAPKTKGEHDDIPAE